MANYIPIHVTPDPLKPKPQHLQASPEVKDPEAQGFPGPESIGTAQEVHLRPALCALITISTTASTKCNPACLHQMITRLPTPQTPIVETSRCKSHLEVHESQT